MTLKQAQARQAEVSPAQRFSNLTKTQRLKDSTTLINKISHSLPINIDSRIFRQAVLFVPLWCPSAQFLS
jgi:hypothetical protein